MNNCRRILFVLFSFLADPDDICAATDTWDGNGGTGANVNFSNNLNWLDDSAPASDLVNTDLIFATTNKLMPNVSVAFSCNSITFNNTAGAFTIGGEELSVGAGGIRNDDAEIMTFTNDVDFGGVASASIQAASGGMTFTGTVYTASTSLTVTGPNNTSFGTVGGSGTLTKNGLGVMTWSGGNVFVDVVVNNGAIGMAADGLGDTFIGSTIQINNAGIFQASENLTLNNSQLSLNGATSRLTVVPGKTLFIQNGGDISLTAANAEFDVTGLLMTGGIDSTITAINLGLSNNGTFSIQDDSVVTVSGNLVIGSFGSGTVTINDASLTAGTATMGQSGFDGTLTLNNGALGSLGAVKLANGGSVNSDGRLNIQSAAEVHATGLIVAGDGGSATSTGIATITGSGSFLMVDGAGTATIGSASGSVGTLNVQSSGSFLSGTGLTTVNATGTVAVNAGTYSSHGNFTLNGGALNCSSSGIFTLDTGKTFTAQAGGDAILANALDAPANTVFTITGAGSTMSVPGSLQIRNGASLNVLSGGSVSATSFLGVGTGFGPGSVLIDGASATLSAASATIGGNNFTGTVTVHNGGAANFTGTINMSNSTFTNSNSTLEIESGGTATAANLNVGTQVGTTTATLTVADPGSSLTLSGTSNSNIGASSTNTALLQVDSGGTLDANAGFVILNATGTLTILAGGNLKGAADFSGTGPVNIAGNYAPGTSSGVNQTTSVTFTQNVTLYATTAITLEIGGVNPGSGHDQLIFNGAGNPHITWGGTLNLILINSFVPQVENSFNLFDFDSARDAGAFGIINKPALSSGLFWRLDNLYSTGVIRVSLTADTFNLWQFGYSAGAFDADDDKDGIKNGVEFLLGTNPKTTTPSPLAELPPVVAGANRTLAVTFKIPSDPATDAHYRVEGSLDLVNWTQIAVKDGAGAWSGSASVTTGASVAGLTQITVTEILDVSFTKRFHRLRAAP